MGQAELAASPWTDPLAKSSHGLPKRRTPPGWLLCHAMVHAVSGSRTFPLTLQLPPSSLSAPPPASGELTWDLALAVLSLPMHLA